MRSNRLTWDQTRLQLSGESGPLKSSQQSERQRKSDSVIWGSGVNPNLEHFLSAQRELDSKEAAWKQSCRRAGEEKEPANCSEGEFQSSTRHSTVQVERGGTFHARYKFNVWFTTVPSLDHSCQILTPCSSGFVLTQPSSHHSLALVKVAPILTLVHMSCF